MWGQRSDVKPLLLILCMKSWEILREVKGQMFTPCKIFLYILHLYVYKRFFRE